jgi:hypothetical protein
MGLFDYFVQAIEISLFFLPWYITAFVIIAFLCGLASAQGQREYFAGKWKWLLLPFAIQPLILAYGLAFQWHGPQAAPEWSQVGVNLLMFLHFPTTIAGVRIGSRRPLVPLSLSLAQIWLFWGVGHGGDGGD